MGRRQLPIKASISAGSVGGSRPAIPNTVNIQVSFSYAGNAIPVGRPGAGPTRTSSPSACRAGCAAADWSTSHARRRALRPGARSPSVQESRCSRTAAGGVNDQIGRHHPFADRHGNGPARRSHDPAPRSTSRSTTSWPSRSVTFAVSRTRRRTRLSSNGLLGKTGGRDVAKPPLPIADGQQPEMNHLDRSV